MLRHWTVDDVPAMARAVEESIDHLRPWMPWIANEPMTLEDRRDRVEGWAKGWNDGGDSYFGVFREGEAVGGTGMHRRLGPGVIEIGYWIGRKHVRNGYATEPARAQVDASFSLPDRPRGDSPRRGERGEQRYTRASRIHHGEEGTEGSGCAC